MIFRSSVYTHAEGLELLVFGETRHGHVDVPDVSRGVGGLIRVPGKKYIMAVALINMTTVALRVIKV